jgi:hypothetical protein
MSLLEELLAIRDKHGELTGEVVVQESAPEDAPLHDRFEWDDAKAGHLYRVEQARGLIRSVTVEYTDRDGASAQTRALISVSRTDGKPSDRTYQPVEDVAQNPELASWVRHEMERDIARLIARYKNFSGFVEALEKAVQQVA